MRVTIRRVYDFGQDVGAIGFDLLTPRAWDAVRETDGPFALASSREEWERAGATTGNIERATQIVEVARDLHARSLCSYGVGGALLEQQIYRLMPELQLTCTDFAPRTAERVRMLFPEAEVASHDLAIDGPLPADLHLMHRLDQELSSEKWRWVFERTHNPILFVPSTILSPFGAGKELLRRVRRPKATSAGWFRNEPALRSLWSPWFDDHSATIGGLRGFVLVPRAARWPPRPPRPRPRSRRLSALPRGEG